MSDERFLRGFANFDVTVAPDPAFAERLFGDLAAELGFRGATGAALSRPAALLREPIGLRLRRTFGFDRPTTFAGMRLSYVVAIVALLLALLAGTLVVGQRLLARPSPAELVRLSQAAYEHPPAMEMVFIMPFTERYRLAADGKGTWRVEPPNETAGSYYLWDGTRAAHFDASSKTWVPDMSAYIQGPVGPFMNEFTWTSMGTDGTARKLPCVGAAWIGEDAVAGRPADHVRCPDHDMDFWLDRETHLILRLRAGPTAPGWEGGGSINGVPVDPVIEAVWFQLGATDPARFDWAGPSGAYAEGDEPPSTVLVEGQPPPSWEGTTADGAAFTTASVRAPAAYLFWSASCGDHCLKVYDAVTAAGAATQGVTTVLVANDMRGTAAGYRRLHATNLPIVADGDGTIVAAWGIQAFPTLVLVGADGNVARVVRGVAAPDVAPLLSALAAGAALPTPLPTPVPTPTPAPTPTPQATPTPDASASPPPEVVTQIPFGERLPAWTGALLDGRTFDSATLRGKPAVLTWFAGSSCVDCPVDPTLEPFGAAAEALDGRATFVLLGNTEFEPGSTRKTLDSLGIRGPVVMDWDGRIATAFDMNVMGTLVLDADGRLVAAFETFPGEAKIAEVLDKLGPGRSAAP